MDVIETPSPHEVPLNSEKLKQLLQLENNRYRVINNESSIASSSWWKIFGFPAKLDENNQYQRIYGYVSCFKCFHTFIYSSKSGTTRLKEHEKKCVKIIRSSSSASSIEINQNSSSLSTQSTLVQHGFRKSTKINEEDIEHIKKLSAQWMCTDLRPFSTIEDFGFRALAQELIRIGHKYGVVNGSDVLRSRHTTARTIYDLADSCRKRIKEKLIEPLQCRAVTICPDLWSDCYKNISYLGLNVSFVDANHQYFSVDLFCRPCFGTKSAELIIKVLETQLSEFGIDDLTMVNIVSDRGSNFVKAFRDFDPLFCFGHRLNNVLKTSFFQNKKKEKKSNSVLTIDVVISSNNYTALKLQKDVVPSVNDILSSEEGYEDDEEDVSPSIPMVQKRKKKIKTTNDNQQSLRETLIDDISGEAKGVLVTLKQCKKIVKFIKKSGLNKEIENAGGVTLHQSIDVCWLSIMESLESILKSFKIVKKILLKKQQQRLMINVDEKTIKQLLLLLKPFKHVIKKIQTGNSPSLHLVLLCIQTLRDVLKSYEALVNFGDNYDNNESTEELGDTDEDLLDELQGITFFLHRIKGLLDEMFILDIRHYVATLMHPKYRSLITCSATERSECYKYVREQLKLIYIEPNKSNQQQTIEPIMKKFKGGDFFRRFESYGLDSQQGNGDESGNESDEYAFPVKKLDELDRYLNLELDKVKLTSNPLDFWRNEQAQFPLLSRLARSIFSIPATSAGVERQFSGAGLVIQERRTNLNPEQLDNILLVRSMQKYEEFLK